MSAYEQRSEPASGRVTRRRLLTFLGAASAVPCLSIRRSQAAGRVFVDALGRTVAIPEFPQRVVPIFSSNTEIVAALGAAERVIGIDGFTRYPPEIVDRPKIGGRLGFSAEAIARLRPDLVITTPARHAAATLIGPMQTAGIPLLILAHRTVREILGNISLIGRVLGTDDAARGLLADFERRLAVLSVGERAPRRVYFETGSTGRGTFHTARAGTYTDDMVTLAGGRNVLGGDLLLSQVTPDSIAAANVDDIVLAGSPEQAADVARRPGWNHIAAVAAGRIHVVPRALFLIPGPRVIDGVERLARLLHPGTTSGQHP